MFAHVADDDTGGTNKFGGYHLNMLSTGQAASKQLPGVSEILIDKLITALDLGPSDHLNAELGENTPGNTQQTTMR